MRKHLNSFSQVIKILQNIKLKKRVYTKKAFLDSCSTDIKIQSNGHRISQKDSEQSDMYVFV